MHAAVLQFLFESNTFNPERAGFDLFAEGGTWLTEAGAIRAWATRAPSQMSGSLAILEAAGWTTSPVLAGVCGSPAGRLGTEAFATIEKAFRMAVAGGLPADGLILHLHGAACAEGEDDVEGRLLEMVRVELGYGGPLVVSLDLHANVTARMIAHADAVTAYRTMPHTDFVETGERAAHLLIGHRKGRVVVAARMAALIPPTDTHHAHGGFAEMLGRARELEKTPGIEDVSLFPVQPWLDLYELGSSVVVTGTDPGVASAEAFKLATAWYGQRSSWRTGLRSWEAIEASLRDRRRPGWILVDAADATTGGSDGRSAEAIRRLLPLADHLPGEALLWVVDRDAVRQAEAGERNLELGSPAVSVAVEATAIHGVVRYRARGGVLTGCTFNLGRTVVLRLGRLRIVVSSAPTFGADPAFYESVGLDPEGAQVILVKSPMGWRAGFGADADRGLVFDGPGQTSLDFRKLPFTRAGRSIHPMKEEPENPVVRIGPGR